MLHLLLSSWLWADLTKTPAHSAMTAACAIIMIVVPIILLLFDGKKSLYVIGLFCMLAGGLEIYGFLFRDNNTFGMWMFNHVGDFFFGLGVIFVVFFTLVFQRLHIFQALQSLSYWGEFDNKWELGFKGLLYGAIVIALVAFFATDYAIIPAVALVFFELWVIFYPIYSLIRWGGSVGNAIFAILLYVVGVTGMALLFAHIAISAVLVVIAVLSGADRSIGKSVDYELSDGTGIYHTGGNSYRDHHGGTYERENMHSDTFYKTN